MTKPKCKWANLGYILDIFSFISQRYQTVILYLRDIMELLKEADTATQYWNSLQVELRQQPLLNCFKRVLHNMFFNKQLSLSHFNP